MALRDQSVVRSVLANDPDHARAAISPLDGRRPAVDYLARLKLMKYMGDVHPLITVLGVIVGLNLFGFMGLIFGPLLISYFLILVKIYINEFDTSTEVSNLTTET